MSARRLLFSRPWILALTVLAVSSWAAAAPTDVLDDCAAGSPHVGIRELATACPQVDLTLQFLGLDQLLFGDWRARLTSHDLDDLSNLVQRYNQSQRHASPAMATLAPILESLRQQQKPVTKSWWDAARDWFRDWLGHSNSALAKWLNEWLEQLDIPAHTLDGVIYFFMGLIVIAAIVVVAREIRVGARARHGDSRNAAAPAPNVAATGLFAGAKPLTGVRELLRSLVDRLLATGRLASAGGLTHRELVERSLFDSEQQRQVFAGIASEAESLLYGPERSAPQDAPAAAIEGHALLQQLSDLRNAP